jgi:Ca2+-binding EF-hand superfamily protein
MILPATDPELRYKAAKKEIIKHAEKLEISFEISLKRLIESEIAFHRECEKQKNFLELDYSYSLSKGFNLITQNKSNYLDMDLLNEFLVVNKVYHNDEHLQAFIRRFDADNDGKLSYKEYIRALMQTSPSKYSSPSKYKAPSSEPKTESLTKSLYSSPVRSDYDFKLGISPSKSTNDKLMNAFKEQIELEKDLEFYKEKLALKSDFNLYDGFKLLDTEGKGWLSKYDLQVALKSLYIYSSVDEIFLFFKRYDTDNDGKFKLIDFIDALLPKQKEYATLLNGRYPLKSYSKEPKFLSETMASLKLTLEQLIKCEIGSERIRQRLSLNPSFDIYDAFKDCDVLKQGYLTKGGIKEFLINHGVYKSDQDIDVLIAKYDINKDGKVSYSEFSQEIQPKSPSKY